jgi:hypothetical protein
MGGSRSPKLTELGKRWIQSLTMVIRRLLFDEEFQTAAVEHASCSSEVTDRRHSAFHQDI